MLRYLPGAQEKGGIGSGLTAPASPAAWPPSGRAGISGCMAVPRPRYGPLPGSLQSINTKIFKEWLPGNPEYEFTTGINIEWYSMDDCSSPDYESQIWLPVSKKGKPQS